MKVAKRFVALTAILLSVVMLVCCVGCTPAGSNNDDPAPRGSVDPNKPVLVVTATQDYGNLNPDALGDTKLLEYAQQRLNEAVGREVKMEWLVDSGQRGDTSMASIQMYHSSGNAPWMYNNGAVHWNEPDAMEYIRQTGFLTEFTVESIYRDLPNYARRMDELGYGVQAMFDVAKDATDGKLYGLPMSMSPAAFPKVLENGFAMPNNWNYYSVYLRDDIMKTLYPEALSAQELRDLYVQKGELTVDDFVGDLNFGDLDSIYDYLVKVKELGLKVGDKPVIPGALCSNSEDQNSLNWSMQTVIGYSWKWPIVFTENLEDSFYLRASEDYREYLRWWNKLYNEGLVDPEIFIMKNDQYNAKAVNGEYAVVNTWMNFLAPATELGAERGYGFRPMPMGYNGALKWDFNNTFQYTANLGRASQSHYWSGIPEADYPDVLKIADFYFSEENDAIMTWGHPDWYTGEGAERRYKDGYEDLVKWTVYGATGGKDGAYYGITAGIDALYAEGTNRRREISPFGFFSVPPDAPRYVYPKTDPEMLAQADLATVMHEVFGQDTASHAKFYRSDGWSDGSWDGGELWETFNNTLDPNTNNFAIAAVHATPAEFDASYAKYLKSMEDAGIREAEKDSAMRFKTLFEEVISKQPLELAD